MYIYGRVWAATQTAGTGPAVKCRRIRSGVRRTGRAAGPSGFWSRAPSPELQADGAGPAAPPASCMRRSSGDRTAPGMRGGYKGHHPGAVGKAWRQPESRRSLRRAPMRVRPPHWSPDRRHPKHVGQVVGREGGAPDCPSGGGQSGRGGRPRLDYIHRASTYPEWP